MKTNWKKGNFVFTGASQSDRVLHALMPENLRIDTRALPDFLSYALHAAQFIRYYNENNISKEHWGAFLEKDPSVFLASVLENRSAYWDQKARTAFRQFYASELTGRTSACKDIITIILEMSLLLNSWYIKSKALLDNDNDILIHQVLKQAIAPEQNKEDGLASMMHAFQSLLFILETEQLVPIDAGIRNSLASLDQIWKKPAHPNTPLPEDDDQLKVIVEAMRPVFQRLHFTMVYLEGKTPGWLQFSIERRSNHEPHIGLLLAYVQLLLHVRNQLNEKPREHLNYYYQDILQQQFIPHIPDRTIVCFQLADHMQEYLLEKNTALLAGSNADGIASRYLTVNDLLVAKTRVAALKNVFVAKSNRMKANSSYKLISAIYTAPVADSRDGLGAPFRKGDQGWPVFGAEQEDIAPANRNMVDASIGFVIASPVLLLQEGERTIQVHFSFTSASMSNFFDLIEDISRNTQSSPEHVIIDLFNDAIWVDVSTAEGWRRIQRKQVDATQNWQSAREINLTLFLSEEDPAIVHSMPEILGDDFDTPYPLLRVLLNPNAEKYLYSFIMPLQLETIRIETQTTGMKSLTLRSNAGLLDAATPFMPFGPVPAKNAYLLIGNAELFRKRLTGLRFDIEWNSVPEVEGGFAGHYKEYGAGINNQSFKVKLSALSSGNFFPAEQELQESFPLFNAPDLPDAIPYITTEIEVKALEDMRIRPDYNLIQLSEYTPGTRTGYFKLLLYEPNMVFGHHDYPRLFTQYMLSQTKSGGILSGSSKSETDQLPREPFVPIINRLSVSYQAAALFNLRPLETQDNDLAADQKIYTVHPFGKQLIFANGVARERTLFPQFEEDGYLFIGLENAVASKPVSLFFSIRESKYSGRNIRPQLFWSYLYGDRWIDFSHEEILYDTTRGFTTTGIIKLYLPEHIDDEHTILSPGLFWIRVAASGNLLVTGHILDVRINAVEAVWEYNGDDEHLDPVTVLSPIENLAKQRSEIAGVLQVAGFSNGRGLDQWKPFYVRSSERLRHKNRGISAWDIERLVLEAFPSVRRVKCVTSMEYDKIIPGALKVVVLPITDEDELEPQFGFHQLDLIYDFLKSKISPFVQLEVINPVYEKIKITCSILLEPGLEFEKGKYLQLLHDELLHFICPWLKGDNILLGGSISKNEVMTFIKERPYVRFHTRFSMIHIYQNDAEYDLVDTAQDELSNEILHASTPWSTFTPVQQHLIRFISKEEYALPFPTAIEGMRLGTDFIILEDSTETTAPAGLKIMEDEDANQRETSEWYLTPDLE